MTRPLMLVVRYTLRRFRSSPGLMLAATLSVGIATGLVLTLLSVTGHLLLRRLEPARILDTNG